MDVGSIGDRARMPVTHGGMRLSMPGRVKAIWRASIRSVGRILVEGKGMHVHVRVCLEREPDRDVSVYLTLDEAKKWRDAIDTFIEKIENKE